jgi:hypothetical protein
MVGEIKEKKNDARDSNEKRALSIETAYHLSKAGCLKFTLQLRPPFDIYSVRGRRRVLTESKKNELLLEPRIRPDLIAR